MRSHITFPFTFLLIINDKQLKNKGGYSKQKIFHSILPGVDLLVVDKL